jgi:hypothetical protein
MLEKSYLNGRWTVTASRTTQIKNVTGDSGNNAPGNEELAALTPTAITATNQITGVFSSTTNLVARYTYTLINYDQLFLKFLDGASNGQVYRNGDFAANPVLTFAYSEF